MNLGVSICLTLGIIFLVFSLIFAILKGKGAILVSGFNSFSKKERDDYDKNKISIDMRNSFFIWSIILFMGAIFSYFINKYCSIIAIIIWIIIFFRDVHWDAKAAFEKYKK
ncbi:DUF3784 domain-containing protein [Clostridium sp. B9]|uniref:DUF3784 domain-containing protein n=1 Tax=Clostridium sp. B9 TaxID=3423224 RepID=UPI003D2EF939